MGCGASAPAPPARRRPSQLAADADRRKKLPKGFPQLGLSIEALEALADDPRVEDEWTTTRLCHLLVRPETAPVGWEDVAEPAYAGVPGWHPEGVEEFEHVYRGRFQHAIGAQRYVSPVAIEPVEDSELVSETGGRGRSYAEELTRRGQRSKVGRANVFVVHAWKTQFKELVRALREHVDAARAEEQAAATERGVSYAWRETFFWLDVFSVNQHSGPGKEGSWSDGTWAHTLRDGIAAICSTVVVLHWGIAAEHEGFRPFIMTRAWCLYEVYSTLVLCGVGALSVALDADERHRFFDALIQEHGAVQAAFAHVNFGDAGFSASTVPADAQMLRRVVESELDEGGCEGLNAVVAHGVQEWLATSCKEEASGFEAARQRRARLILQNMMSHHQAMCFQAWAAYVIEEKAVRLRAQIAERQKAQEQMGEKKRLAAIAKEQALAAEKLAAEAKAAEAARIEAMNEEERAVYDAEQLVAAMPPSHAVALLGRTRDWLQGPEGAAKREELRGKSLAKKAEMQVRAAKAKDELAAKKAEMLAGTEAAAMFKQGVELYEQEQFRKAEPMLLRAGELIQTIRDKREASLEVCHRDRTANWSKFCTMIPLARCHSVRSVCLSRLGDSVGAIAAVEAAQAVAELKADAVEARRIMKEEREKSRRLRAEEAKAKTAQRAAKLKATAEKFAARSSVRELKGKAQELKKKAQELKSDKAVSEPSSPGAGDKQEPEEKRQEAEEQPQQQAEKAGESATPPAEAPAAEAAAAPPSEASPPAVPVAAP